MKRFGIKVDKQYFNFASAHFLLFPDGTREELHGHNYQVSVEIYGPLEEGDVVLNFIPFKPLVKRCCDELDHHLILPRDSTWLRIIEHEREVEVWHLEDRFIFPKRDVRILPILNTSSERLAEYLATEIRARVKSDMGYTIHTIKVSVQESPGQAAVCEMDADA
jgi:6-pyruvoyltetrahydropterin/6-carboxytetrahydropterin synthase